jgi:hypothetical protein
MSLNKIETLKAAVRDKEKFKSQLALNIDRKETQVPRLAALNNQLIRHLADALLAGKDRPDTNKLKKEISSVKISIEDDHQIAAASAVAIDDLDGEIAVIEREISGLLQEIRKTEFLALDTEFSDAVKQYESGLAKLRQGIATVPETPWDGTSITQSKDPRAVPVKIEYSKVYAFNDLLGEIEHALRQMLAIANVQYKHCNRRKELDIFTTYKREFQQEMILSRRTRNIEFPDNLFGEMSADDQTDAILARLRTAGVQI